MKRRLVFWVTAVLGAGICGLSLWATLQRDVGFLFPALLLLGFCFLLLFLQLEGRDMRAGQLALISVMTALAAGSRILLFAFPSVKPTTAIVMLTGMACGPTAGLVTGALSALVSNIFLGQGPWTLWQMAAWGLCGLLSGWIGRTRFPNVWALCAYGALFSLLFGACMNLWTVLGFVRPLTWSAIVVSLLASLPFDLVHCVTTVFFLFFFGVPWGRKLARVQRRLQ